MLLVHYITNVHSDTKLDNSGPDEVVRYSKRFPRALIVWVRMEYHFFIVIFSLQQLVCLSPGTHSFFYSTSFAPFL